MTYNQQYYKCFDKIGVVSNPTDENQKIYTPYYDATHMIIEDA